MTVVQSTKLRRRTSDIERVDNDISIIENKINLMTRLFIGFIINPQLNRKS